MSRRQGLIEGERFFRVASSLGENLVRRHQTHLSEQAVGVS